LSTSYKRVITMMSLRHHL